MSSENKDAMIEAVPQLAKQGSVIEAYQRICTLNKEFSSKLGKRSFIEYEYSSDDSVVNEVDSESSEDYAKLNLQAKAKIRRNPTLFERQIGKNRHMVQEEEESRILLGMLDQWHKIKMERLIDEETEKKKLNDKIMSFAAKTQKSTVTKHESKSSGRRGGGGSPQTSVIKSVSKPGHQSYKYQEIIRKQEALAEYHRKQKEKQEAKIKEAKFLRIQ